MYSRTSPGTRSNHKRTATYCTEQHYWITVAEHSLSKHKVKMNAVAHTLYAATYQYIRQPSTKKPLHKLDAEPFLSKLHPEGEALSELLAALCFSGVFIGFPCLLEASAFVIICFLAILGCRWQREPALRGSMVPCSGIDSCNFLNAPNQSHRIRISILTNSQTLKITHCKSSCPRLFFT